MKKEERGQDARDAKMDRREFVSRAAKAGLSIAATGALGFWLYDKKGPAAHDIELVTLPDFSVRAIEGKVMSVVNGTDRRLTVNKAIDLLGGIERFVSPGDVVAIKPNVAFATAPMIGATVHPDVVSEVVKLCYSRGKASKVIVFDNPINSPESCFALSGIGKAARSVGGEVLLPSENQFARVTLEGGKLIKTWPVFYEPLTKADKLIGISPVKDHHRSAASMSMKNWYGLLGGPRNVFHQDINGIISELAQLVKPSLVILDGTFSMMSNGPTGGSLADLRQTNTMIASCDMVAADAFGARLLDLKAKDLPYIMMAEKAGVGTSDYESAKPIFAG